MTTHAVDLESTRRKGPDRADARHAQQPIRGEVSTRGAAQLAGAGYLAIFVLSFFANFFVLTTMVESGDAAATVANIRDGETLFRLGLVSFVAVFALDVLIAWALYIVFRTSNRDVSLVAAWFRLVYTVFLGVAAIFLFETLQLIGGDQFLSAFDDPELGAQTMVALDAFTNAWLLGLVCFGVHLILLGYLVVRSQMVTRVLGVLLMIAGCAYIVDTLAHALLVDYENYENAFLAMVAIPSVVAELWLGLWLLLKCGKNEQEPAAA